jgi:hypothetical protein
VSSVATSAASTVVRGTAAISPTEPHRARTISTATTSVVATVLRESVPVTKTMSRGSAAPA